MREKPNAFPRPPRRQVGLTKVDERLRVRAFTMSYGNRDVFVRALVDNGDIVKIDISGTDAEGLRSELLAGMPDAGKFTYIWKFLQTKFKEQVS